VARRTAAAAAPLMTSHRAPPTLHPSSIFAGTTFARANNAVAYQKVQPPPPPEWQFTGPPALGVQKHRAAPERPRLNSSERPWSAPADQQMRLSIAERLEPALQTAHRHNNKIRQQMSKLERHNRHMTLVLSRLYSAHEAAIEAADGEPGADYAEQLASIIEQSADIMHVDGIEPPPPPEPFSHKYVVEKQKAALYGKCAHAPHRRDAPPGRPPTPHPRIASSHTARLFLRCVCSRRRQPSEE
jgi:hypothetical protein